MQFKLGSILFPYQAKWVADDSRFKIWLASRQIGKSFAAACEIVRDCYLQSPTSWLVISAGERQAVEFLEKVRRWAVKFDRDGREEGFFSSRPPPLCRRLEIRLGQGSRVIALPSNADTVRGYSANILLDEFAFHKDSEAIWRALLPTIANPLHGSLKVRVLSTANGMANAFHRLWTDVSGDWSRHRTTVHEALAAGLNMDIEAARRNLSDPDGWAQEYECEFLDTTTVFLPYELIDSCEDPQAAETAPWAEPDSGLAPPKRLFLGVDIGRKHDRTVIWGLEEVGDVLWTRLVKVLEKAPFKKQYDLLLWLSERAGRVCVDATGMGAMLAEELKREFGAKIELCEFTVGLKQELYPLLRRKFEDRSVRIPVSLEIREDLHGLRRSVSQSGSILYQATQSDEGHCDRAAALALAIRAADGAFEPDRFIIPPGPLRDLLTRPRYRGLEY